MYKKIMAAVDGSPIAEKVVSTAKELAQQNQAELVLVHVAQPLPGYATGEYYTPELMEEIEKAGREVLEEVASLEILKSSAPDGSQVLISTELLIGHPVDQICNYAKKNEVDLIIIGSRGLGPFREFFLGSVSHGVAQRSEVPVLIVKSEGE